MRNVSIERKDISINVSDVTLPGILSVMENPAGLVIFAHGAGSSRLSPRNMQVAGHLNSRNFATLLFDLLTEEEDRVYENRFDIDLITRRLVDTTRWLEDNRDTQGLNFGYFGASTGAAAALKASIFFPGKVKAVVSRGGRPDLVLPDLKNVRAATLLIVGGFDSVVIDMNQRAYEALGGIRKMIIIPSAGHLFEEPGKLEEVSKTASGWFEQYLGQREA